MYTFTADKKQKLSKACLKNVTGLSFSVFNKLLRNKDVKINGARTGKDVLLEVGDTVVLYYVPTPVKPYSVIHADENVVIIDKLSGFETANVTESLKEEFPQATAVHRLDRNTSGIMVFALNNDAENSLKKGFKAHSFNKTYRCTVFGVMRKESDVLVAYLKKDAQNSLVKIYDNFENGSVKIKTGYQVVSTNGETSDLKVTLYTGKTHQIRAHLAHVGHFIIGDGKYGNARVNKKYNATRQKLKAEELTFHFERGDVLFYLNDKTFSV